MFNSQTIGLTLCLIAGGAAAPPPAPRRCNRHERAATIHQRRHGGHLASKPGAISIAGVERILAP